MLRRLMMAEGGGGTPAQGFLFNPSAKVPEVTLSSGNVVATTVASNHNYARCTLPKSVGKWLWEFKVDAVVSGVGNIAVGLERTAGASGTVRPGMYGGALWTRQSAAAVRIYVDDSNYTALSTAGNILTPGDIATLTIDFSTKELTIYRNGVLVGSAIVSGIDTSTYSYVPNIKIWGAAGNPTVISIPATISHPVAGFSPWA